MILRKWIVKPPLTKHPRRGAVIVLPGRGIPGSVMLRFCRQMELRRTMLACMEPYRLAWYPMPNGAGDQHLACLGLDFAVDMAAKEIKKFLEWQELKMEETILLGFSAGSVVALQLAIRSDQAWGGCVSLGGAILEPEKVAAAKNNTPIILQHNADDECFKWYERYLPMRDALEANGYNVTRLERPFGHHTFYVNDAVNVATLVALTLGYSKSFVKRYLLPKIEKK